MTEGNEFYNNILQMENAERAPNPLHIFMYYGRRLGRLVSNLYLNTLESAGVLHVLGRFLQKLLRLKHTGVSRRSRSISAKVDQNKT